jgi:hypothetical protein
MDEKVQNLIDAANVLADTLDQVGDDLLPYFSTLKAHQISYTGKTYEYELIALRNALKGLTTTE